MFTDITEKKKIEKELIKSEQNLKTTINALDDLVLLLDKDSNFIDVNDAYCKLSGISEG